jgi:glycosyltransferase involved in cell wall biosynthesis
VRESASVAATDHTNAEHPDVATSLGRVAIVHDYLNQRGGAERVVLELASIWPRAPIHTSLFRPRSTFPEFVEHDVRASVLDRVPVDRGFRNLFALYPAAFRSLGELDADVVIASSSGWAHIARAVPRALHVVYCHTPARWLYGGDHLGVPRHASRRQALLRPVAGAFRRIDRRAASRADLYIANSREVQRRILEAYGIESTVVHPPVDTERYKPCPRGERLLVVSRLLPYKRVDLVVRAARRLGISLDVVGEGPMLRELRAIAGAGVTFHGAVSAGRLVELFEGARSVCLAGTEDFGMVAVEAQAAGKPVVAHGRGGALETVEDGVTGVLFEAQTEESVAAAIAACDRVASTPEQIAGRAARFGRSAFRRDLLSAITARLESC